MKIRIDSRIAVSICTAALLTSCGGSQPPIGAPGAMAQTAALAARSDTSNYKVLYRFNGGASDGASPLGGLIDLGGKLYGTTFAGGPNDFDCGFGDNSGCGTVFSVTLVGTEKVLHTFGTHGDGHEPAAGLIDAGGTLYGTTSDGGSAECYGYSDICGTVFSITLNGTERLLHSFSGPPDGASPQAGLIDIKGTFYGTTSGGGGSCYSSQPCGTVFTITKAGTEKILYKFSRTRDGEIPEAGLIDVGGELYGTTLGGGTHAAGTVFRLTLSGKEKVLHRFGSRGDGAGPVASLIEVKGKLYGTTAGGGTYGGGTVFSITPGGKESVLHSFGNGADGAEPVAPLIEVKGTLYGTTDDGGAYSCYSTERCGTVFSVTPSGKEKVLHSFGNGTDGSIPRAGLIDVDGTLYGTTTFGGTTYDCPGWGGNPIGCGTIFAITP